LISLLRRSRRGGALLVMSKEHTNEKNKCKNKNYYIIKNKCKNKNNYIMKIKITIL